MKTKSAYREHSAENKIDGTEAEPVTTVHAEAGPDVEDAVVSAMEAATVADQSKYHLLRQLEQIRAAEAAQRQFMRR